MFGHLRLRNQLKGLRQVLAEKLRIEESRIASNALFQAFMDHSPLVAYVKDAHGRLIYYNQLFAERFGVTRSQWLEKDDFEIWPAGVCRSVPRCRPGGSRKRRSRRQREMARPVLMEHQSIGEATSSVSLTRRANPFSPAFRLM